MSNETFFDDMDALYNQGEVAAAINKINAACEGNPTNLDIQANAALWLMNHARMTDYTLQLFERALPAFSDQSRVLWAYAQTGLFADGDDPSKKQYREAALRAISLDKDFRSAYEVLLRIHLRHKKYTEAYIVAQAALRNGIGLGRLGELAEKLMTGIRALILKFDEIRYQMPLSAETPACIHGSQLFLDGKLFEAEELRFTKEFVGQVDRILEVGTLLGNHTAYYQKNLGPREITCVEAHPELARLTRETAETNQPDGHQCETRVENCLADREEGVIETNSGPIPKRPIDSFAQAPFDFIKIDVDGAEMAVLAGAEHTLSQGTPKMMIEASDDTDKDVLAWMDAHSYKLVHTVEHGQYNNHFLERTKV